MNGEGTAIWALRNTLGSQLVTVNATEERNLPLKGNPFTFHATATSTYIDTFRYKATFTLDGYDVRTFELDLNLHFENGTITGYAYGSSMNGGTVSGSTDGNSMTINIDWDNHIEPKLLGCDGVTSGDGCPRCTSGQYHDIRKWSIKGTTNMTHSSLNSTYTQDITDTQMALYPSNDGITCEVKPLTQTTTVTGTLAY